MTEHQIRLVKDALLTVERRELKALKSLEGKTFEPSQAYRQNMQRLIRKETHWSRPFVRTKKRKLLTVLVATLLILSSLFSISAIREPIIEYLKKAYEKSTHFFFEENASQYNDVIETEYTLTWLPEEYSVPTVSKTRSSISYYWNKNNSYIRFNQKTTAINSIHLNTEKENYTPLERNDQIYYYNKSIGSYFFIWSYENYTFNLSCSEDIDMDTVLKILDNIQPVSDP